MAGEGLIWSALGQGIANAGTVAGQYMYKDIATEEAAKEKRELQQERLAATERENARNREMRLEIAESRKTGGGGGAGGLSADELAPGGKLSNMVANKLGMSEPEYKKLYEAAKTGDKSGYEQEVPNYGEENVIAGSKALPKGFEDEFKAKQKLLGSLQEQYALAGKFDDVAKGRQIEFGTETGKGVLAGAISAGKGGEAVAVSQAKPLMNIEGGEEYNQYTGASKTTPVGKSQITENLARAGELGALGKKYGKDIEKIDAEIQGGMFNKNSSERLTSVINAANGTIKSLNEGGKGNTAETKAAWQKSMDDAVAVRDQAQALQKGALEAKANPPAPKPEAGGMPEPKSASEVARLKPGTRFKAPDGSIRIR